MDELETLNGMLRVTSRDRRTLESEFRHSQPGSAQASVFTGSKSLCRVPIAHSHRVLPPPGHSSFLNCLPLLLSLEQSRWVSTDPQTLFHSEPSQPQVSAIQATVDISQAWPMSDSCCDLLFLFPLSMRRMRPREADFYRRQWAGGNAKAELP